MRAQGAIRAKAHAAQPCMALCSENRKWFIPPEEVAPARLKRRFHQDLANALPKANTELGAFTRIGLTTGAVEMARRTTGLSSI